MFHICYDHRVSSYSLIGRCLLVKTMLEPELPEATYVLDSHVAQEVQYRTANVFAPF
jgi:hypothetical protein